MQEEDYFLSEEDIWDTFMLEEKKIAVIKNPAGATTFAEIKDDEVLIELSNEDFARAEEEYEKLLEIFEEK